MHLIAILLVIPTLLGGTLSKVNEDRGKVKFPASFRRHDGTKKRLLDINKDLIL